MRDIFLRNTLSLLPIVIPFIFLLIFFIGIYFATKKISKKYYEPVRQKILDFRNKNFFSDEDKNKARESLKKELLELHDTVQTGNSKITLKIRHWILRQIMSL